MFPANYFPTNYYTGRYWPPGAEIVVEEIQRWRLVSSSPSPPEAQIFYIPERREAKKKLTRKYIVAANTTYRVEIERLETARKKRLKRNKAIALLLLDS